MQKVLSIILVVFFSSQLAAATRAEINGREIKSLEQLHQQLAKQLKFPARYAKGFNSLYVALTNDSKTERIIKIKHLHMLTARLGSEASEELIDTLVEASRENPRLIYVLE